MKPSVPKSYVMRWKLLWKEPVALHDFINDPVEPLTLWVAEGKFYQPFRRCDKIDFGSVPLVFQSFVSPVSAPKSFIVHDTGYDFHHMWTERGLVKVTRHECDDLLYVGMRAEKCNIYLATKALVGVRAGGWTVWSKPAITIENAARLESALANPMGTPPPICDKIVIA